jgi:hypothetical protein
MLMLISMSMSMSMGCDRVLHCASLSAPIAALANHCYVLRVRGCPFDHCAMCASCLGASIACVRGV